MCSIPFDRSRRFAGVSLRELAKAGWTRAKNAGAANRAGFLRRIGEGGTAALRRDDADAARDALRESLRLSRELGFKEDHLVYERLANGDYRHRSFLFDAAGAYSTRATVDALIDWIFGAFVVKATVPAMTITQPATSAAIFCQGRNPRKRKLQRMELDGASDRRARSGNRRAPAARLRARGQAMRHDEPRQRFGSPCELGDVWDVHGGYLGPDFTEWLRDFVGGLDR